MVRRKGIGNTSTVIRTRKREILCDTSQSRRVAIYSKTPQFAQELRRYARPDTQSNNLLTQWSRVPPQDPVYTA